MEVLNKVHQLLLKVWKRFPNCCWRSEKGFPTVGTGLKKVEQLLLRSEKGSPTFVEGLKKVPWLLLKAWIRFPNCCCRLEYFNLYPTVVEGLNKVPNCYCRSKKGSPTFVEGLKKVPRLLLKAWIRISQLLLQAWIFVPNCCWRSE